MRRTLLIATLLIVPLLQGNAHSLGGLGPDLTLSSVHVKVGGGITTVTRALLAVKDPGKNANSLLATIERAIIKGPGPDSATACCSDPSCTGGCWSQGIGIQWRYYS